MCQFFSCVSDGKGQLMYFNAKLRKQILDGRLNYAPDSHSSIAGYFSKRNTAEDNLNKYEYNPLTKDFKIDQINASFNDSDKIRRKCLHLDFSTIVPQLIIKPIIHPFDIIPPQITEEQIKLLREVISVRNAVGNSVGNFVINIVWDSVINAAGNSVRNAVGDSVWNSVRNAFGNSVINTFGNSVRNAAGDSVWNSVVISISAYIGSFFNLPRQEWKHTECIKTDIYPFQPFVDLWEQGLVPSYDGKTWRLHGGEKAGIVHELAGSNERH